MSDPIDRQVAIDSIMEEPPELHYPSWYAEKIKALPSAPPELCGDAVSRNSIVQRLNKMDRYISTELRLCDTDKIFPQNEVFIVDDVYEEIVEQLPPAQPEQRWIPCSERLPKKTGQYYVSGGDKVWICEFFILNFTGVTGVIGGWCNDASNPVVQAWMPLPEPYKERQADDEK